MVVKTYIPVLCPTCAHEAKAVTGPDGKTRGHCRICGTNFIELWD